MESGPNATQHNMAGPDSIAEAFLKHFYNTFDTNRAGLGALYQKTSMMTYEGDKKQGNEAIAAKYASLPFKTIKHSISKWDVQPLPGSGLLVVVTGKLLLDDSTNPLLFSEAFTLMPLPGGKSYFILNHIFRLNYA
eukprot:TRINITY_DN557_c0_g1_i2.p1 TRINITY_DN557_c0_g1~~TRINITY_DN557_c0_g1_i2.p1  ORF type:complete len:136 (+),score=32.91 TRINITY_DN557_c0_g1_i2:437-844(+)